MLRAYDAAAEIAGFLSGVIKHLLCPRCISLWIFKCHIPLGGNQFIDQRQQLHLLHAGFRKDKSGCSRRLLQQSCKQVLGAHIVVAASLGSFLSGFQRIYCLL